MTRSERNTMWQRLGAAVLGGVLVLPLFGGVAGAKEPVHEGTQSETKELTSSVDEEVEAGIMPGAALPALVIVIRKCVDSPTVPWHNPCKPKES